MLEFCVFTRWPLQTHSCVHDIHVEKLCSYLASCHDIQNNSHYLWVEASCDNSVGYRNCFRTELGWQAALHCIHGLDVATYLGLCAASCYYGIHDRLSLSVGWLKHAASCHDIHKTPLTTGISGWSMQLIAAMIFTRHLPVSVSQGGWSVQLIAAMIFMRFLSLSVGQVGWSMQLYTCHDIQNKSHYLWVEASCDNSAGWL